MCVWGRRDRLDGVKATRDGMDRMICILLEGMISVGGPCGMTWGVVGCGWETSAQGRTGGLIG